MSLLIAAIVAIVLYQLSRRLWKKMEFSHGILVLGLFCLVLYSLVSSTFGHKLPSQWDKPAMMLAGALLVGYIGLQFFQSMRE